jgi:hypothetical protein
MSTSMNEQLNTYGALFVSLMLACACTAIEGFVAHAFQETLGDIVISENSLCDVGRIKSVPPRQGVFEGSFEPFKDSLSRGHDIGSNQLHSVMTTMGEIEPRGIGPPVAGGKRLDARGFFQTLPMGEL